MDSLMDVIKDSNEPQWLEQPVVGDLKVWQIAFLCLAGVTTLIVMVCCCFRFRIPRTKQQIEADSLRRKITTKFRLELETIQDSKMGGMSLHDAVELLHAKQMSEQRSHQTPAQGPLTAHPEADTGSQKPGPQVSGMNFVKFANKVATLSKLGAKPASASPSDNETYTGYQEEKPNVNV